jgi:hypothetical protein
LGTVPVLAAILSTAFIAAVSAIPQPVDFWAMGGALAGGVAAITEARSKARSWKDTAGVFLVCWCVGSFGPAIAYALALHFGIIGAALDARITWHWWAAAGLLFAGKGWAIYRVAGQWIQRAVEKRRCAKCAFPPIRGATRRPPRE